MFLLQWVIVNPLDPRTYEQADAMLRSDKCAGLKFHPEEHCYTIKEYGEELFKFGAARGATILVHSGDRERQPNSLQPARDQRRMLRLCWDISASVARLSADRIVGQGTRRRWTICRLRTRTRR